MKEGLPFHLILKFFSGGPFSKMQVFKSPYDFKKLFIIEIPIIEKLKYFVKVSTTGGPQLW